MNGVIDNVCRLEGSILLRYQFSLNLNKYSTQS